MNKILYLSINYLLQAGKKMHLFYRFILVFLALIICSSGFSLSYYYYEDFEAMPTAANGASYSNNGIYSTNGWSWNYRLGRDVIAYDVWHSSTAVTPTPWYGGVEITNNGGNKRLFIYGRPNNEDLFWNNWCIGDGIKFDPKSNQQLGNSSIIATPENPFGYTIVRYTTSIDASCESQAQADYHKGFVGAWLGEDMPGKTNQNDSLNNFIIFEDKSGDKVQNSYGYYYNADYSVDITTLTSDFDGKSVGNTALLGTDFRKIMDDNNAGFNNSIKYSTAYSNPVTRPLGIKMTTDGSKVRIYVNFNPTNETAYGLSNSWVLIVEKDAAIAQDLIAYFGDETTYYLPEGIEAQYDNFLIRTVTSNIQASISPQKVVTNGFVRFNMIITNFMGTTNDSGIGEFVVKKPASYTSNWILSNVSISNEYGMLTVTNTNMNPPSGYASVSTNSSGDLYIRFNMSSGSSHQILTNSVGVVNLQFSIWTSPNANSSGENFEVYADCVKHADTGPDWVFNQSTGIKYATTGKKKAYPVSSDSLSVQVYTSPAAYAMLSSPNSLVVGQDQSALSFILSTEGISGAPNISYARIYIPAGFTVSNNNPSTNISSMVLGSQSFQNCYLTNINGSNFIFINYMGVGGFPGINGWDTISFNNYGTPAMPGGINYTNFLWQVSVDSSGIIGGTVWQNTITNSTYSHQTLRMTMSNAQVSAYITPQKAAINTTVQSNQLRYSYFIENTGQINNNVYGIRIDIPGDFLTNSVTNIVSTNGGITKLSNSSIWVNYASPLTSGQKDTILFYATHTNTDVNASSKSVPFYCYADNNNSIGYTIQREAAGQTWSVTIVPPLPAAENQLFIPVTNIIGTNTNVTMNPVIYTSDVTNTFIHKIYNTGAIGVNIKLAVISVATNYISSIFNVSSSLAGSHYQISNINGSNYIYLKYYENNTNLLSMDQDPAALDTVQFTAVDSIAVNTFSIMPTNIGMPVTVYKTTNVSMDPNDYSTSAIGIKYSGTNKIYVEYPHVALAYYIVPNKLDTTTITNSITYFITNLGMPGNSVHNIKISIPTNISTNIQNVNGGVFDPVTNNIVINFPTPLDGGQSRTVTFNMIDIVDGKDIKDIYLYPWVSNDRESVQVSNVVLGMSGKLDFLLPKPKGGGGVSPNVFFVDLNEPLNSVLTQQFTITVTNAGVGTDRFNSLKVDIPDALNGLINTVYSTKLGVSNQGNPLLIKLNATNFEIIYSNASSFIPAKNADTIIVTALVSNLNSLPTNGVWDFYADNGSVLNNFPNPDITYFELTDVTIGSSGLYGTERPTVSQNGDTLTTVITNTFDYVIQNGSTFNGEPVSKARIEIPWPYTAVIQTMNIGGQSANLSTNGGYIWLNYVGPNYLSSGNNTAIEIKTVKPLISEATNVLWNCDVYYLDNSSNTAVSNVRGDPRQMIVLPNAYFYSYVSPNDVGKDEIGVLYTFTITNYGEIGNNLYKIKIVPPTTNSNNFLVMTNIDSITSVLAGTNTIYSNDGCVYIDYGANNTNIVSKAIDTVSLRAYDNQDSIGFKGQWAVYTANGKTMNPTIATADPETGIGKSLSYNVIMPDYDSTYYVIPNSVSTVSTSNTIKVVIENAGKGTNNINNVRIYLQYPFLTNNIAVSSSNGAAYSMSSEGGTNYVDLQYPPNTFVTNKADIITLNIQDEMNYGDTNILVDVKTRYNTSVLTYIPSRIQSGFTNLISFLMPPPVVSANFVSDSVYTVQRDSKLRFRIINNGLGSNELRNISLTVNSSFTNGLTIARISDNLATNIIYDSASGTYEMNYSNFVILMTNDIVLEVTNTNTQKIKNFNFDMSFNNGIRNTNLSLYLNVDTPPTASLLTKEVYAPNYSNDVKMNFFNYSSGSSSIYYLRITPPNVFTNLLNPTSAKGTVVSNLGTNIVIYYASGLAKTDNDTIEMWAVDSNDMVETSNVPWKLEADNTGGYSAVAEDQSNSLEMSLIIPQPSVSNIVYTKWYVINTGSTELTNSFILMFSNIGEGANSIFSNIVVLPSQLSTVLASTLTNTKTGSRINFSGNSIIVEYTNSSGLFPGECDTITFMFTNTVTSSKDLYLSTQSYNGSSKGDTEETFIVSFISPQEPTEGYVDGQMSIYSIDNNAVIKYHINNGMYDHGIRAVRLSFDNTQLFVTNIYSTVLNQNLSYNLTPSNIIIHYNTLLPPKPTTGSSGSNEILLIAVNYTNNHNWTNYMNADVLYDGAYDYAPAQVKPGENNFLPVMIADFGRVTGIVLPGNSNPTIKLYNHNSAVTATNKLGNQITAGGNSTTGQYTLDNIPAGTYDIGFIGNLYKEDKISGVQVLNNVITNISLFKLRRDIFNRDSTTVQTTVSLDDTNCIVTIPAGTLGDNFSIDIWITNVSVVSGMREKLTSGGSIKSPSYPDNVKVYNLDIRGVDEDKRYEQELKNDVIISLHYNDIDISSQGWKEGTLAIYYWRSMTKEWIRIGGAVDTTRNMVTIKASYLHQYYAIVDENPGSTKVKGIVSVKTDPKIFTPGVNNRTFKNIKISIGFEDAHDTYQVKIYDLRGNLIRSFVRSGEYKQGEIYWDGTDEDGYNLKTGVYIYKIIAGTIVYSGTIVIVR